MMSPARRLVPLLTAVLLVTTGLLVGAACSEAAAARGDGPREVRMLPGGVPVTSLTYDERVFFDFDQDRPRPEAGAVLDALAVRLEREAPPPHVVVLGHTDALGSDAYNLALSRRRAVAVVQALAARGLERSLLDPVAVGRRQPVACDASEAGRARNRRVEFLISPSARAIAAVLRARLPAAQAPVRVRVPASLARAPFGVPVPY